MPVELEDAGIEEEDVRLLGGKDLFHLPHYVVGLFLGLGCQELLNQRVVGVVVETGSVIATVQQRVVGSIPEGSVISRQSRITQRPSQDEHVEVQLVRLGRGVNPVNDGVEVGRV